MTVMYPKGPVYNSHILWELGVSYYELLLGFWGVCIYKKSCTLTLRLRVWGLNGSTRRKIGEMRIVSVHNCNSILS